MEAFVKFRGNKGHLGGVFCLSGCLAMPNHNMSPEQEENMKLTPLFIYHGTKDKMIEVKMAKEAYRYFEKVYLNNKTALTITYD